MMGQCWAPEPPEFRCVPSGRVFSAPPQAPSGIVRAKQNRNTVYSRNGDVQTYDLTLFWRQTQAPTHGHRIALPQFAECRDN